jgi:CelD/BcsL family acetyltransferase involved in cellulose biosynthesis
MTSFALKRTSDLTDADWSLWLDIQAASRVYESPYFRPEFTRAIGDVRHDAEVVVIEDEGQNVGYFPFQRGKLNLGRPIGGKMSDYHGPIVRPGTEFDPGELLAACRLACWDFDHLVTATSAFEPFVTVRDKSPQMDLNEGFAAYSRHRRDAGSDAVHRQGQKTRKLAREVGAVQFDFDANDEEAYALLLRWKSEQFTRTGLTDVFSFEWTRSLLDKLRQHRGREFSAPLSILRAGDKVAAACLSLRSGSVLHSWFTAYNPEMSSYSPGMSLFVRLGEEAEQLGLRTVDLGRGEERYKWSLANASAVVCEGSVSRRSLGTLLRSGWRQTRDWVNRSPLAGTTKLLKPMREWMAYH